MPASAPHCLELGRCAGHGPGPVATRRSRRSGRASAPVIASSVVRIRHGDTVEISGAYQYSARYSRSRVQRFWHEEKERIIRKFCPPLPGDHVLDMGCGSGVIADRLAELGAHVTGIDSNPAAVAFARATFARPNLEFRQASAAEIDLAPGSLDRIYCLELVEHLYPEQTGALLASFARLLRPGGTLTLTTPNYRGLWPAIELLMDRLRLAPVMANEQHVTRFDRTTLKRMLDPADWRIVRLASFCTLAPFLSTVGWRLAKRCAELEDRADLKFGNLLLLVAIRQDDRRERR